MRAAPADVVVVAAVLKFDKLSIKTKLILLLLAFGLGPALTIFAVFRASEGEFVVAYRASFKETAVAIGDTIDRNLFERYGDVQAFGLNAAAHDPRNWRRPEAGNPLVAAMNGYMTGYGIYRMMMLVDTRGAVLAVNTVDARGKGLDTAALYGESFAAAPWFKKAIASEFLTGSNGFTGTVVEQPRRDATIARIYGDDGYVVTFAAPVKDDAGKTIAVWANFADFGLVEEIVATFHKQLAAEGKRNTEITVLATRRDA